MLGLRDARACDARDKTIRRVNCESDADTLASGTNLEISRQHNLLFFFNS